MKQKQTRKQKLRARAEQIAKWRMRQNTDFVTDYIVCYERGYRDAMQDARRSMRGISTPEDALDAVTEFLKPIR